MEGDNTCVERMKLSVQKDHTHPPKAGGWKPHQWWWPSTPKKKNECAHVEFFDGRVAFCGNQGMEDAPVTLPNHPLKKFADAFTKNFDVIAERKSVVFHLRELAKASVMAKYLVDSKARLDPTWYKLADEIVQNTPPEQYPEIPQLWNMRGNSRIQLKNGKLVDIITGGQSSLQAIYGGVEFGLDRLGSTNSPRSILLRSS